MTPEGQNPQNNGIFQTGLASSDIFVDAFDTNMQGQELIQGATADFEQRLRGLIDTAAEAPVTKEQLKGWYMQAIRTTTWPPESADFVLQMEHSWSLASARLTSENLTSEDISGFAVEFIMTLKNAAENITSEVQIPLFVAPCKQAIQTFVESVAAHYPHRWKSVAGIHHMAHVLYEELYRRALNQPTRFYRTAILEIAPDKADKKFCEAVFVDVLQAVVRKFLQEDPGNAEKGIRMSELDPLLAKIEERFGTPVVQTEEQVITDSTDTDIPNAKDTPLSKNIINTWYADSLYSAAWPSECSDIPEQMQLIWKVGQASFPDMMPMDRVSDFITCFIVNLKDLISHYDATLAKKLVIACRQAMQAFVDKVAAHYPDHWKNIAHFRLQAADLFQELHQKAFNDPTGLFNTPILEISPDTGDRYFCEKIFTDLLRKAVANLRQVEIVRKENRVHADMILPLDTAIAKTFDEEVQIEKTTSFTKTSLLDACSQTLDRIVDRMERDGSLTGVDIPDTKKNLQSGIDISLDHCDEIIDEKNAVSLIRFESMAFHLQHAAAVYGTSLPPAMKAALTAERPAGARVGSREEQRTYRIFHEEMEENIVQIQENLHLKVTSARDIGHLASGFIVALRRCETSAKAMTIRADYRNAFNTWLAALRTIIILAGNLASFLPRQVDANLLAEFSDRLKLLMQKALDDSGAPGLENSPALKSSLQSINDEIDALPTMLTWHIAEGEVDQTESFDFGLEGDGPFSRADMIAAFMTQTAVLESSTNIATAYRKTIKEQIEEYCPDTIHHLSELRQFMHWLAGHAAAFSVDAKAVNTGNWRMQDHDAIPFYFWPIIQRIGERFGENNLMLTPHTLQNIAIRSSSIITPDALQKRILEALSSEKMKKYIIAATNSGPARRVDINQHFAAIEKILPDFIREWIPNGVASSEEVLLLDTFLSTCIQNCIIFFELPYNKGTSPEWRKFMQAAIDRYLDPVFQKFNGIFTTTAVRITEESTKQPASDFSLWYADTRITHDIPDGFETGLVQANGLQKEQLDQVITSLFKTIKDDKDKAIAGQLGVTAQTKGTLMAQVTRFRNNALAIIAELTQEGPIVTVESYQQLVAGIGYAISTIDGENAEKVQAYLATILTAWFESIEKDMAPGATDDTADSKNAETEEGVLKKDALVEAMKTTGITADQTGTYIARLFSVVVEDTAASTFRRMVNEHTQQHLEVMTTEMTDFAGACTDIIERLIPSVVPSDAAPSIAQLHTIAAQAKQEMLLLPTEETAFLPAAQRVQMIDTICESFTGQDIDAADLLLEEPIPILVAITARDTTAVTEEEVTQESPKRTFKKLMSTADQLIQQRTRKEERQKTQEARDAFPGIAAQLENVQSDIQHLVTTLMAQAEAGDMQAIEILRDIVAFKTYMKQSIESRMQSPE